MRQITERVYGILTRLSFLNMYIIVGEDGLAVVDIGVGPGDVKRVADALATQGYSLADVRYLLITHAHFDHIGGLAEFQRQSNAHTVIHRLDAPIVRGEQIMPMAPPAELGWFNRRLLSIMQSNSPQPTPARVDSMWHGDDDLGHILPGLRVVHLPGHSHGHCGLWWAEKGLLITGDALFNMPWGLTRPLRLPTVDMARAHQSIRQIVEMEPAIIAFGHGPVMAQSATARVRKLASNLKD